MNILKVKRPRVANILAGFQRTLDQLDALDEMCIREMDDIHARENELRAQKADAQQEQERARNTARKLRELIGQ